MSPRLPPSDGQQAPLYHDWPCALEIDGLGNFIVTAFHLEGCRGIGATEELAIESVRQCIRAYVVGDFEEDFHQTKADPVLDTVSGRIIEIRVDVSTPAKT